VKREPVAELGADGYRIVRRTHDVELAEKLMRELLSQDTGEPYTWPLGKPEKTWIRIVPCLPGTLGHGEGWAFEYQQARAGSRGAFRAVIFS
jgi:hypothetical protein